MTDWFFYLTEIAEQIQTNNAQKNDDIKQENRQLQNEKNELILQVGWIIMVTSLQQWKSKSESP